METILLIIHVILSITVIGLVLIQHGKGAEAGAAFGSGASATVFGARGAGSFLTKLTTLFVALFFITSIGLFILAAQRSSDNIGSVVDVPPTQMETESPQNPSEQPTIEEKSEETDSDVPKIQ